MNSFSSKQATVKSPHNFPLYDSIGDKDILPGFGPEQRFEQIKAENLLEEIDDIF